MAELPVCTCHTALQASPARRGGNKKQKDEGEDASRQDSQVMGSTQGKRKPTRTD